MRVPLGDVAQRNVPAVLVIDVEPRGRGQHHRLAEPHRIPHRIGNLASILANTAAALNIPCAIDRREPEQLGGDRVGVDRVVVAPDRRRSDGSALG